MDDEDLLQSAAGGDEVSLDQLLERHLPQLRAYVHTRLNPKLRARESSNDIVQSVCRDVLAQRGRFDFRGEESFRAWLFTAALNKIRMKFRMHHAAGRDIQREVDGNAALDVVLASTAGSPTRGASNAERAAIVHAALGALREDHREVITLARVVGRVRNHDAGEHGPLRGLPDRGVSRRRDPGTRDDTQCRGADQPRAGRLHRQRAGIRARLGPCGPALRFSDTFDVVIR